MVCMRIAGGHVCGPKQRARRCRTCGALSQKQCDYRLRSGRTCDEHMCEEHAHVQPGEPVDPKDGSIDYCPRHHAIVNSPPRPGRRRRPAHEQLLLGGT